MRTLDESFCEQCPGIHETEEHIFCHCQCPSAVAVWTPLGIDTHSGHFRRPWLLGQNLQLPTTVNLDVFLLVLWHIWKARNPIIIEHRRSTARAII
ncbi:hypothetical protein HU200_048991 [Digitaria exilis]|uniref:Reverse transcriptase zinc-binding domain-containing protein n=1 Tax=Digitaria exilis TaxID=1010633 RepID=A0A835B0B9_9POAL|nr:hypothetical protein HU200_048991 [Digitaria exilis]